MSQSDSVQASNGSRKGKTLYVVLALSAVLIVVLVGVVVYLLNKPQEVPEKQDSGEVRATVVTPENVDEVKAKQEEKVEGGFYACQMNVEWNFKDSSSASYNAYVANSEYNNHTVYFDLFLSDTNEKIYSSPYIPVGSELKDIKLDANLAAGTYPALVTYHLVDEEKNELSTVTVTVTLYVEN